VAQLPRLMKDGDRQYAVQYQLIAAEEPRQAPEKILVIFTDITERLRAEEARRHQSDLLELFQHIMRDKPGFLEFLTEAEDIVRSLQSGRAASLDEEQRLVHTLKGNAAMFGLRRVAEICHALESRIDEEGTRATEAQLGPLFHTWSQIRADLAGMLGEHGQRGIEIDDADYQAILKAVLDGVDSNIVLRMIESWPLEPAGKRLARIGQQIRALAQRMGKGDVHVEIAPHDLRLSSERFAPFWSAFIHVLRNAVDHGIEDEELRKRRGKPRQGCIRVATSVENGQFRVTVEDDGPGVDWEALRARAGAMGIDPKIVEKRENLVFLPGVSSKASVTELSGRGVGMAAVREACEALGGRVEIASEAGRGTRVTFAFPKDLAVYEGHAAILRLPATQPVAA
jgi:two-component system chemotaxis sensor kinase CheA